MDEDIRAALPHDEAKSPCPRSNHFTVPCSGILLLRSPLFKLARLLVRFDHVAGFIVNTNHGIM